MIVAPLSNVTAIRLLRLFWIVLDVCRTVLGVVSVPLQMKAPPLFCGMHPYWLTRNRPPMTLLPFSKNVNVS